MRKIYGFVGLMLVIFAFAINFLKLFPNSEFHLVIAHYPFLIGLLLLADNIDFEINGNSLLHKINKNKMLLLYLLVAGILIGIFMEFYGLFIANAWSSYFNTWPLTAQILHYSLGVFMGYGIAALIYPSLFNAFSSLQKTRGEKVDNKNSFQMLFNLLFVTGIILLVSPLVLYKFALGWDSYSRAILFPLGVLGLLCVSEYYSYKLTKESFVERLLKFKWNSIFSMLGTAFTIGIIWESLNKLQPSWTYQNLLFANIRLFGIPIYLILGWIPLVMIYLNITRILQKLTKTKLLN